MVKDRFVRLQLFEKHIDRPRQTTRFIAGIDLNNSKAHNVVMYIRMETKFDDPKKEKIESGRLWLSGEEFLQLASLMIHSEELFRISYKKGTYESQKKMKAFRDAWEQLKKETWE